MWSQEDWDHIRRGYRAQDMDEKWNVFAERQVVFIHRSWTGNGVFEASFAPDGDGWRFAAAVAESNSERARKASAEFSRVLLELVLSAVILGEPAAALRAELITLSSPQGLPAPPPGAIEHSILGMRSTP